MPEQPRGKDYNPQSVGDPERLKRMTLDLLTQLYEDKALNRVYGDTTICLKWRDGVLQRVDFADNVTYK